LAQAGGIRRARLLENFLVNHGSGSRQPAVLASRGDTRRRIGCGLSQRRGVHPSPAGL
jgi:hypothetical protein